MVRDYTWSWTWLTCVNAERDISLLFKVFGALKRDQIQVKVDDEVEEYETIVEWGTTFCFRLRISSKLLSTYMYMHSTAFGWYQKSHFLFLFTLLIFQGLFLSFYYSFFSFYVPIFFFSGEEFFVFEKKKLLWSFVVW